MLDHDLQNVSFVINTNQIHNHDDFYSLIDALEKSTELNKSRSKKNNKSYGDGRNKKRHKKQAVLKSNTKLSESFFDGIESCVNSTERVQPHHDINISIFSDTEISNLFKYFSEDTTPGCTKVEHKWSSDSSDFEFNDSFCVRKNKKYLNFYKKSKNRRNVLNDQFSIKNKIEYFNNFENTQPDIKCNSSHVVKPFTKTNKVLNTNKLVALYLPGQFGWVQFKKNTSNRFFKSIMELNYLTISLWMIEARIDSVSKPILIENPEKFIDRYFVNLVNAVLGDNIAALDAQIITFNEIIELMSFIYYNDEQPPENELQKSHESNTLSEHQLRVQASLQRLNIPDWFKQYSSNTSTPTSTQHPHHHHHHHHHHHGNTGGGGGDAGGYTGNFYRKRNSDVGGTGGGQQPPTRWAGLNSKTTSLSSLGSHRSDKSPLMLSPSAHSHHGQTGFSRWSTSHLNSTQTSPSISTRGSFTRGNLNASTVSGYSNTSSNTTNSSIRNSFRQPYLGWRSQEKLSQPRTPAERLASTLISKQQEQQQQERERQQRAASVAESQTPENQKHQAEIQSSIKEVTSAIVHYVNDQTNRQTASRSRSASPNTRKCWLESSFVGNRPLESPQTPVIDNSVHEGNHLDGSGKYSRGVSPIPAFSIQPERPSPGSATLEDVLASLLGLPLDSHRSSESIANENFNYTNYNNNDNISSTYHLNVDQQTSIRRRSEGDAQQQQKAAHQHHHHHHTCNNHGKSPRTNPQSGSISSTSSSIVNQPVIVVPRRVSLDSCEHTIKQQQQQQQKQQAHLQQHQIQSQQFVQSNHGDYLTKCRYPKCDAVANAVDAKKFYKSCHNCSNLYCSRECRRAHWEKHRKACLHSRVSSLCRQVLSTCKDDADSLRHLSLIARKGYLSQGRGVVRILFRSPENADSFIKQGFQCIGEAGYVRWADLLPSEMGPELYSELLRLSTEYKPDSKMLVYVAICVVSEAPGSGAAPVKWERQLVSRCAKLKLCKTILANEQLNALNHLTNEQHIQQQSTDVLILTFSTVKKSQKTRELISRNIQGILKERGINLRKNFPEVFQRLNTYVDGLTERFLPVTIHPRDNQTGKSFICIIMPNSLENGSNITMPVSDTGNSVQTIDVSLENLAAASSMLS